MVSFACLSSIHATEERRDPEPQRHLGQEIREALRFVRADPYLRMIVVVRSTSNFFLTAMNAIDVVFLVRTVGIGPGAIGLVFAVGSIGGVLGAIVAPALARRWGSSRTVLAAATVGRPFVLLLPLTMPGAGLSFWITGVFILEGAVVTSNVLVGSFLQTYVPREMLGRVSACTATAAYSMMPAGALAAGALATTLGLRATMWLLCTGIALSAMLYIASPMRTTHELPTLS
jgi:predicted MFS family arabinose efflux permease